MRHNRSYPGKEVDVHIQDQTSPIVEAYMVIYVRTLILANPTVIDSYDVVVADASLVTVGNVVTLQNKQRGFQGKVLSKVGNILTLDSPFDYVFPIEGTAIREGKTSLNVNGSVTPITVIFKPTTGVMWDIYSIALSIVDNTAMDDSLFGGLPSLTKGIVLRKTDGESRSYFNIKSNGGFSTRGDLIYSEKAPSGYYGLTFIKDFPKTVGVAIRLNGDKGEQLELIIQDDLSGIFSFTALCRGHIVED